MREVLTRAREGDTGARLGVDVYVHALRKGIGAMAAVLSGLDVLVFTGGVGERSPEIRARAAEGLGFLAVEIDGAANDRVSADEDISAASARVRTIVVHAREDLEMAREVRRVLSDVGSSAP
jgi:acetate kinase